MFLLFHLLVGFSHLTPLAVFLKIKLSFNRLLVLSSIIIHPGAAGTLKT